MSEKLQVLFVCVANDSRSPMAEASLRLIDSEHFDAHSAGIQPSAIDPRAIEALEHAGIPAEACVANPSTSTKGNISTT